MCLLSFEILLISKDNHNTDRNDLTNFNFNNNFIINYSYKNTNSNMSSFFIRLILYNHLLFIKFLETFDYLLQIREELYNLILDLNISKNYIVQNIQKIIFKKIDILANFKTFSL